MLIKSQTKISHKILYTEILHAPGVLNFGHVYIAAVKILVFSTVTSVPRLGILQRGSSWLRLKEFQDTMCFSGYTTMEKGHFCQH